jgi:hypothetical protein
VKRFWPVAAKIKDSSRKKQTDEHEESKRRRILEQFPNISESTIEFVLSLQWNKKYQRLAN